MQVRLDQNFMARIPEKLIRQSKRLVLRKRVAEQEKRISLLMDALELSSKNSRQKRFLYEPPHVLKAMINGNIILY